MTRPRDLIGLAKGNVRVSMADLSLEDRKRLFSEYVYEIGRHYEEGHKGGSSFVEWELVITRESPRLSRSRAFTLDEALWPKEKDYNRKTRITLLSDDYFRMPGLQKPVAKCWNLGDAQLNIQFCLTNDGRLYLEWYEGTIVKMHEEHSDLPEKVLVTIAKYIRIPTGMCSWEKVPDNLKLLLQKDPSIINSFGHGILALLDTEAREREKRARRDRTLFNELNSLGKLFGITNSSISA